jgi:hypothetical protein
MALRPAPKRKVDLEKLDDLQKEIFGSETEEVKNPSVGRDEEIPVTEYASAKPQRASQPDDEKKPKSTVKTMNEEKKSLSESKAQKGIATGSGNSSASGANFTDMETIAANIASSKAGQGRNTTRPFSLPRTLIIDTSRLKAKFRTIDEQFTQNVIIDFLLREALAVITPENYRDIRTEAFEFVKRADETTRRSLTITEEVVYQMSELKAGINLETGKKYSNDEIFSTLLAIGVSWLYRNGVLN